MMDKSNYLNSYNPTHLKTWTIQEIRSLFNSIKKHRNFQIS